MKSSSRWRHRQKFTRKMTLSGRIDVVEAKAQALPKSADRKLVQRAVVALVKKAREQLGSDEFERAWRNLIQAEQSILRIASDDQLEAKARALASEIGTTLPPEEAQPLVKALQEADLAKGKSPKVWRESVLATHELYDRRLISLYDGRERASGRITGLSFAMGALLILLIFLAICGLPVPTSLNARTILAASTFGALGACLSALFGLVVQGRRPSAFEGMAGTFARPLVGAVSGVIGLMVAEYGLKSDLVFSSFVVAFFFGFSERLVFAAAQRLESK